GVAGTSGLERRQRVVERLDVCLVAGDLSLRISRLARTFWASGLPELHPTADVAQAAQPLGDLRVRRTACARLRVPRRERTERALHPRRLLGARRPPVVALAGIGRQLI